MKKEELLIKAQNANGYLRFGGDKGEAFNDGFIAGYEAKEAEDKWISVEEKSPDVIGNYLVFTDDGLIWVCSVNQVGWWTMLNGKFSGDLGTYLRDSTQVERRVTHWQPLPNLPSPPKQ